MSDNEGARREQGADARATGWSARVRCTGGSDGFAYVPGEVVTTGGKAAVAVAQRLYPGDSIAVKELSGGVYQLLSGVPDALRLIADLRRAGLAAQPNHVFFAHDGCGCCCGPHPALVWAGGAGVQGAPVYAAPVYASPVYAHPCTRQPVYASPVYASPVYASPVYASARCTPSPVYASPVYASAEQATGRRPSSARPAVEPWVTIAAARLAVAASASSTVPVVVLDTGLAMSGFHSAAVGSLLPLFTSAPEDGDQPDDDADLGLDPAAGHGTFIAGLIEQVAPGVAITLRRVLHAEGDGDEVQIAAAIDALPDLPATGGLLNLSFGGYSMEHPGLLAAAVAGAQARGYVVVASAGNDGTCRPTVPGVAARCRLGGRGRPARARALQQLRPVGAGLRAGRGSRELVLRRLERRRPVRR